MVDDKNVDIEIMKSRQAALEAMLDKLGSQVDKMGDQVKALEKMTTIMDVNNRELPDLKNRLRQLEEDKNKRTGAMAVIFILGGLLSTIAHKAINQLIGGQ